MTVNKCDRCGKYYEDCNIRRENGVRIVSTNSRGEQLSVIKHMDLCRECIGALKNFLNIDGFERMDKLNE